MNRELKFRILDKLNRNEELLINNLGKIFVIDQGCGQANEADDQENYVIQQYTGLKGKNGKEIYEGDIILNDEDKEIVRWGFCSWLCGNESFADLDIQSIEVIGNVCKNPELIKNNE